MWWGYADKKVGCCQNFVGKWRKCIQYAQLFLASGETIGQQWCDWIWELWQQHVQDSSGSVGAGWSETWGGCDLLPPHVYLGIPGTCFYSQDIVPVTQLTTWKHPRKPKITLLPASCLGSSFVPLPNSWFLHTVSYWIHSTVCTFTLTTCKQLVTDMMYHTISKT